MSYQFWLGITCGALIVWLGRYCIRDIREFRAKRRASRERV